MPIVTHPLRRKILAVLVEHRELTRSELTDILAVDPELPTACPEHLAIVLHHNHLPRLAEQSFIEYDHRTGDISRWKEPAVIQSQLDAVTSDE